MFVCFLPNTELSQIFAQVLAICKSSPHCPHTQGHTQEASHGVGRDVAKALGMPMGKLGGSADEASPAAVDRISDRGREAVSRNNISLICSILSPDCSSPSHSLPPSHEIHKPVLDGVRKKLVAHSWDSQALRCSHFPPWEKSWAEKVGLGIELCHLGRGVIWVK